MPIVNAMQNCVTQWSYTSGKSYADPFNDCELDVQFTDPDGQTVQVPAYWAGDQSWGVRYASDMVGRHAGATCQHRRSQGQGNQMFHRTGSSSGPGSVSSGFAFPGSASSRCPAATGCLRLTFLRTSR